MGQLVILSPFKTEVSSRQRTCAQGSCAGKQVCVGYLDLKPTTDRVSLMLSTSRLSEIIEMN